MAAKFFEHDMTPQDPRNLQIGSFSPLPLDQSHRRQGFDKGGFEKNKTQIALEKPAEPKRGDYVLRGKLHEADPGQAEPGQPSAFFAGMHSTDVTFKDRKDRQKSLAALASEEERAHRQQILERRKEMQELAPDSLDTKAKRAQEASWEKKRDLEMLTNYNPWGKPGGGAPKGDNKLISGDKTLEKQITASFAATGQQTYVDQVFGHEGGGAPLTNEQGTLKAKLTADNNVLLPNVARANPNFDREHTRAKAFSPTYGKELLSLAEEQHARAEFERKEARTLTKDELEYNPFGKPGAGARNVHDATLVRQVDERTIHYRQALQEQMATKAEDARSTSAPTEDYDPWGKGLGAPVRNSSGKIIKPAQPTPSPTKTKYKSFAENMGTEGGGAPYVRSKSSPTKEVSSPEPKDIFGNATLKSPPKFTDEEIKAKKEAINDKKKYLRTLQDEMEERKYKILQESKEMKQALDQEEFFKHAPPVGRDGSRNAPNFTGTASDYRRHKTDVISSKEHGLGVRPEAPETQRALALALSTMQQDREATLAVQKQQELTLDRTHAENSLNWQGKGQGAPRRTQQGEVSGRFALDDQLHLSEPLTNMRSNVPPQQRKEYQTELDRLAQEKAALREARRKLSATEATKVELKGFNKPGNGAPLRTADGKLVNATSKMVPRSDTHLLNTSVTKH